MKRRTKHTPGPYTIEKDTGFLDAGPCFRIGAKHPDYSGGYIAEVYGNDSQAKNNARLFKYAPDLYRCLVELYTHHALEMCARLDYPQFADEKCKRARKLLDRLGWEMTAKQRKENDPYPKG